MIFLWGALIVVAFIVIYLIIVNMAVRSKNSPFSGLGDVFDGFSDYGSSGCDGSGGCDGGGD